jgi:RNA polymerase sigma-70 factor (ECF subfamily)
MQDDGELVVRCLEGDTDAYSGLVHRYQNAVYATAYYYAGRYGAAEDIAQEAFLTAYRSLPWLKQSDKFGPWLKSITCRTAANWLRRHQRQLSRETPLPFRRTISIEDVREGPRGLVERAERFARVQRAIDSLPERYRLPVILRYLQELNYDEISSFTGETRDEIRGVLQRAGSQLRDILADMDSAESAKLDTGKPGSTDSADRSGSF